MRENLGNTDGKMTCRQIPTEASRINLHLCSTWVPLVIHGPTTGKKCGRVSKVFPTANSVPHGTGPESEHFNNRVAAMHALLSEKLPDFDF